MYISAISKTIQYNRPALNKSKNITAPLHFKSNNYPDCRENLQFNKLPGQIYNDGRIFTRAFTRFFRLDLNWAEFAKYIQGRFADVDKVNTYIWGCSSGQEAYSLSMLLKKNEKNSNKYRPIIALDIDKDIIEKNIKRTNGKIKIPEKDVATIHSILKYTADDYGDYLLSNEDGSVGIAQDIIDSVKFSQSNIVTDFSEITDSTNPSIVMCRNMWPYIEYSRYDEIAKTMYKKLAPGSIVVIGNYDLAGDSDYPYSNSFPKALARNGFIPEKYCHLDNQPMIYKKPFEDEI